MSVDSTSGRRDCFYSPTTATSPLSLVHPLGGIEKEYEIIADSILGDDFILAFKKGIEIDGVAYRATSLKRTGPDSVRAVLLEGKNREIRRVLEHFGRKAKVLRRVRIGLLTIDGLAEGSYRELSADEVAALHGYGSASR